MRSESPVIFSFGILDCQRVMWLGELSRVFFRSVFIYASLLLPKFSFLFSSSCLQLFFWDRFKSEFIVAIVHAERLV